MGPARWTTTLSSEVNLPHGINFGALCGANMVTFPSESRGTKASQSTERMVWGQVPCRHSRSDFKQPRPLAVLQGALTVSRIEAEAPKHP